MKIGPYEVIRLLGKGGMSEVYEVVNPRLASRRALKLFTYQKEDPEVRARFLTEGRLLARLCHPRIVKVIDFDIDEASGRPYFVMDLVLSAGGDPQPLSDVEPGSVGEERIGIWYDDLREGLAYIHGQGVVHRDLKLQNVLVGPDGHAVLADFGIAKIFAAGDSETPVVDTVQTLTKVRDGRRLVMGSIGYMAPELEMGVTASPQSDWYALGVITYRLLTGSWCDARTDIMGMLEGCDPAWKRILPRLLHSNPSGRECLSFAEERNAVRMRAEIEAEALIQAEKSRGRVSRIAACVLLAVAVALAVALSVLGGRYGTACKALKSRSVTPTERCSFDKLFFIPPDAKDDDQTDDQGNLVMPSETDLEAARVDLLILTYELLEQFNAGKMSRDRLVYKFEELKTHFEDDGEADSLWPTGYLQVGMSEDARWLLERAIERLENQAQ